jgi:hypothetical protein
MSPRDQCTTAYRRVLVTQGGHRLFGWNERGKAHKSSGKEKEEIMEAINTQTAKTAVSQKTFEYLAALRKQMLETLNAGILKAQQLIEAEEEITDYPEDPETGEVIGPLRVLAAYKLSFEEALAPNEALQSEVSTAS